MTNSEVTRSVFILMQNETKTFRNFSHAHTDIQAKTLLQGCRESNQDSHLRCEKLKKVHYVKEKKIIEEEKIIVQQNHKETSNSVFTHSVYLSEIGQQRGRILVPYNLYEGQFSRTLSRIQSVLILRVNISWISDSILVIFQLNEYNLP